MSQIKCFSLIFLACLFILGAAGSDAEDCSKCTRRDFTAGNISLDCQCEYGFFCNAKSNVCKQCLDPFNQENNHYQRSKERTTQILENLLRRYNARDIYHLLKKLNRLASSLNNQTGKLTESIQKIQRRIHFVEEEYKETKKDYEIIQEKFRLLQTVKNDSIINEFLDNIKKLEKDYEREIPLIREKILTDNVDSEAIINQLHEISKFMEQELPKIQKKKIPVSSLEPFKNIVMKTHKGMELCEGNYEKIAKQNRSKLELLKTEIEKMIKLLFSKSDYPSLLKDLAENLGLLWSNIKNTTTIRDNIFKMEEHAAKVLVDIKEDYKNIVRIKKISDALTNISKKIKELLDKIGLLDLILFNFESRCNQIKLFKLNITQAEDLLRRAEFLRNSEMYKLRDLSIVKGKVDCLEMKLTEYMICLEKVTKLNLDTDDGVNCKNLDFQCKLTVTCDEN